MRSNRFLYLLSLTSAPTLLASTGLSGGASDCVPDVLSMSPTTQTVYSIDVEGDLVVCGANEAIDIFDVSSPTQPTLVGSWPGGKGVDYVAVDGTLALVGAKSAGTYVLDISDPSQPVAVANIPVHGTDWARDVEIDGTIGYVGLYPPPFLSPQEGAGQSVGVVMAYDLSDPTDPEPLSSHDTQAPEQLFLDGTRLFVGGEDAFTILDVSNPSTITTIGVSSGDPLLAGISGVCASGDRAFVSRFFGPATVIDISDPPTPVPTVQFGDISQGIFVRGLTVYLPSWEFSGGFRVFDASAAGDPGEVARITTIGTTYCATTDGELIYTAGFEPRMTVLDSSLCQGSPFTSFCESRDEALALCPCSNEGGPATGCDNPQGTGGVRLSVIEQATGAQNRATLEGSGFPTNSTPTAIVIRADSLEPTPVAFGDGLRCVGVPLVRLAPSFATGGTSEHVIVHGAMAGSGSFHYQLWYRSTPAMFCTPDAFNLSNGRTIPW